MRIIITLFLIVFSSFSFADCDVNSRMLGAQYAVSSEGADGEVAETELTIWRNQAQVLWEYPRSRMAETWHQDARGQLLLTRYFDDYQRGIEYYASDIKGAATGTWERLWQVIPAAEREGLDASPANGDGCQQQARYSGAANGREIRGDWLIAADLPASWQAREGERIMRWQLKALISDEQAVIAAFARRDVYQLTDYADIGDNESDPFLLKMMNLGFVDGSSHGGHASTAGSSGHQHH